MFCLIPFLSGKSLFPHAYTEDMRYSSSIENTEPIMLAVPS